MLFKMGSIHGPILLTYMYSRQKEQAHEAATPALKVVVPSGSVLVFQDNLPGPIAMESIQGSTLYLCTDMIGGER